MPMAKPACVTKQTTTTHHMHVCAYEVLCHGDFPPIILSFIREINIIIQ